MANSFFDRFRDKVQAVGKGAKKLTQAGQLKLDLMSAKSKLEGRYTALGKACANRLLERGEASVEGKDSTIAQYLLEIEAAQDKIAMVEGEIEELNSE